MVADLFSEAEVLISFPKIGRKIPERDDPKYREIHVPPFRVMYKLEQDNVVILTVIHSRRNTAKIVKKLK
jgi:toxin ParE1/3/4